MDAKIDAILHYIGDWIDDHFGQYVEDSADDLTSMIKKIGEVRTMDGKWIPVSERLPETGTYCLVCCKDGFISTDNYFCYGWDDWEDDVVAWMPLPEPYRAESEDEV